MKFSLLHKTVFDKKFYTFKKMKFTFLNATLFCLIFSLLFLNCKKNKEEENNFFESYRYELWKNLVENNYSFDFLGTINDNGSYDDYNGQSFDKNHEGIGGFESEDVLDNINEVLLNIDTPDLILLSIGGNDLLDGGNPPSEPISNITQLINELQNYNSYITIFLEQIAPASNNTMTTQLTQIINDFNSQIVTLANSSTNNNSNVIAIDMYSDFNESYLADDVHYNEVGAKFIADKYFSGIQGQFTSSDFIKILPIGDSRVEGNRP
jgi:lysophospholipase L1-like esterase